jgi:hypothetical protein
VSKTHFSGQKTQKPPKINLFIYLFIYFKNPLFQTYIVEFACSNSWNPIKLSNSLLFGGWGGDFWHNFGHFNKT